jgi:hypothetical protein
VKYKNEYSGEGKIMFQRYEQTISLKPQVHEGAMSHYWKIDLINDDGRFTIHDGWAESLQRAQQDAYAKSAFLG